MAQVVDHVVLARHVAGDAFPGRAFGAVAEVFARRVVGGHQAAVVDVAANGAAGGIVALQADIVAVGFQARAMGIVAIAAGHALGVHPALYEGAVFEDFVPDLSVQFVEHRAQRTGQVVVEQARRRIEAVA